MTDPTGPRDDDDALFARLEGPGSLRPWVEVDKGVADERRIFTLRSDTVRSATRDHEIRVDRLFARDWVNVVALTGAIDDDGRDAREILLVRQYRFGARDFTVELPAGLVEPGEPALDAGLRELREETGYAPVDGHPARVLGDCQPNPAFMDNRCTTVFCPVVERVGEPELDDNEELELLRFPAARVFDAVARGHLRNALGLVGLLRWKLEEEAQGPR